MKLKLVCVEWVDARAHAGWFEYDYKNPPKNVPVRTYGLLVHDRKDAIVLASSYDPKEKQFADRNEIPKGICKTIKTIKVLEV